MARRCLRCDAPIPSIPQNKTRKRCEPCAAEHHLEVSVERRSEQRRSRVWSEPFECNGCGAEFHQEQRPGVPARYCPDCRAIREAGKAKRQRM